MKIGVITNCFKKTHREGIEIAAALGLSGVQIYATTGSFSPETLTEADKAEYKRLLSEKNMVVSALCADMGGFGFERAEDNSERIEKTKRIIDLAVEFGAPAITTHIGVIPSDKSNPTYKVMLDALTEIGLYAKSRGVTMAIETGPEKAKTLLAFIEDTKGGVGVNLDPANFTMVTNQDAVEAVYLLKDYIVHTHLKDGVLLANAGHFNVEINKNDLLALSVANGERKPSIEGFTMADGRIINLLADGRLVNLAAGNGHPAEIMDMSFALQAKCLEYLAKTPNLEHKLYSVPVETDIAVAEMKLAKTSVAIDALSAEQKEYLGY